MSEILYDKDTLMTKGYPKIKKLGACSPNGEMTPFMWKGRLMRMELVDPGKGTDSSILRQAGIRDVETGEFLSYFGADSYYHSAFVDGDTLYVTGVDMKRRDTIRIYETKDLVNWKDRDLFTNPEWIYFNSQIAGNKEVGYYIILETGPHVYKDKFDTDYPCRYIGHNSWTMFFAKSPDLVNWEFLDYDTPFSKDVGTGGPALKYSEGWFYLLADCLLPRRVYVNYMYRTKDFKDWYVGYYNPILMPSDDDRIITQHYTEITDAERERLKTAFNVNNTDLDICDWNGKTYINYLCGNQLGNYWMAEAICDMPLADFLRSYFNE